MKKGKTEMEGERCLTCDWYSSCWCYYWEEQANAEDWCEFWEPTYELSGLLEM